MTTLNTTEDLLRVARENREFREAFRREILTEELIAAPGDIKELKEITINIAASGEALNEHAATTNQQLAIMADGINSLQQITEANAKGISDLVSGIAGMNKNLNEKIDGGNRDLGEKIGEKIDDVNRDLGEKIDEIRSSHNREHDEMHRFRGNYAIEATRNNDSNIAELFTEALGIKRFRLRTLTRQERDDLFDENLDAIDLLVTEGKISKTFPTGDIIAKASYRRSGDTIFYMAVEASYTVNAIDVSRASDHAKILREATGREAFAIVSGVAVNPRIGDEYRQRIISDLAEYMESKQDDVVFWFQLTDSSLEPPPPC